LSKEDILKTIEEIAEIDGSGKGNKAEEIGAEKEA